MITSKIEEIVLDADRQEPWESAAELHTALCYWATNPKRFDRLVCAACADQVRVFIEEEPHRRHELIEKYGRYPVVGDRAERKNIIPNLEDAQRVGQIVLALVKETATGQLPEVGGEARKPTLDMMMQSLWPQRPREDR